MLMGEMADGKIIEGEHNITMHKSAIKRVFYKDVHNLMARGYWPKFK